MQKLTVHPELCTGCLNCQTVCALTKASLHERSAAAVRVELQVFSGNNTIVFCRHCETPKCLEACGSQSIHRNVHTGALYIGKSCTRCGNCVKACPYDAVFQNSPDSLPVKCDLCGGAPACAEACIFNAITYKRS